MTDQALLLDEDTDVEFGIDATDIDGDVSNGNDSFAAGLMDDRFEVATVSITVNAIDDADRDRFDASTLEDTELVLPLAGR